MQYEVKKVELWKTGVKNEKDVFNFPSKFQYAKIFINNIVFLQQYLPQGKSAL